MDVCLVGKRGSQLDEGKKNFGMQLYRRLAAEDVDVTFVDPRRDGLAHRWRSLVRSDPDVIHMILGPRGRELAFLRALSAVNRCESVVTATQPTLGRFARAALPYLAPSLVHVQSTANRSVFDGAGYTTEFLPSGVDLSRFDPVDDAERDRLRDELGIPESERVFLHVGHFERDRGVESLLRLQRHGHLVVVGSPSTGCEADVIESLRDAGVTVQTEYVPDVEKYYQAADVYAFPVRNEDNSIQIPLSVFEAMACDIPVVSTRFGGLTDLFEAGDGLRFVDSFDEVDESDLAFDDADVATREKVSEFSWDAIVDRVVRSYERLCDGGTRQPVPTPHAQSGD